MNDRNQPINGPLGELLLEAMQQIQTYRECCIVLSRVISRADVLLRKGKDQQAHAMLEHIGRSCTEAVVRYETTRLLQRAGGVV